MNYKISIISPCYNGELYLMRFLDSLLAQTYDNFEIIIINDGSVDGTVSVLKDYVLKFKKRNIDYKFFNQENKGQASAINLALEYVAGDILMWPDSDDYYNNNALEIVNNSFNSVDSTFLRFDANVYDESNLLIKKSVIEKTKKSGNIFIDLIDESIVTCSGRFAVKTETLFNCLIDKKIYESRGGQNWQILLPVAYNNNCHYFDIPIYNYVIRQDSHSRYKLDDFDATHNKYNIYKDIMFNSIAPLNCDHHIYDLIEIKYFFKNAQIFIKFNKYGLLLKSINESHKYNVKNVKYHFIKLLRFKPIFILTHKTYSLLSKIKRRIS
jgi:glycosyltransferase involved in cell wall biosynthesis